MKFRVRAKLDSTTRIARPPLVVVFDPYLLQFEADETRRVVALSIERRVDPYKHLLPVLTHLEPNHSSLTYPDNPVHTDILALLQYLESVGSFWCGIKQIIWERADFDWLRESEAERTELVVWNLRIEEKYPEIFTEISDSSIRVLLQRRPIHEQLTVPLAFYREGRNEFDRFRYVQAFMNFYFMIEGLFGGGGPNYRVKENFSASPTLVLAARGAAETISGVPRHVADLRSLVRSGDQVIDAPTVLNWLVDLRGTVHHYSIKNSRPQAHPHNQRAFEPAAFLAMAVCTKLMPHLIGEKGLPDDVGR